MWHLLKNKVTSEATDMTRPNILTAAFVKNTKTPGRYGDGRGGQGLILVVKPMKSNPRLSKAWIQRMIIAGKPTHLGLGSYPVVTLQMARDAALANARLMHQGIDPRSSSAPTFGQAVEKVITIHKAGWKNPEKTAAAWRSSFKAYAAPIVEKRVDKIPAHDIMATISPVWNTKRETAKVLKIRIGSVMKWAIAKGYRKDNPLDSIASALPKNGVKKTHHKALPYAQVGQAVAGVRASGAYKGLVLAFQFLVLTAARSGEVRGAHWDEIDLDEKTWTIPGERMKNGREHRVPLSPQALAVLDEARELLHGTGLVFPSVQGKVMADATLSGLCRDLNIPAVPHGFRSSFRDWATECSNQPREVAEMSLAHIEGSAVERAYRRTDLFEARRSLMDQWAKYLTA